MERRYVKEWICRKNLGFDEYYAVKEIGFECEIVKETEKACNVVFKTNYGRIYMWTPKSQMETQADKDASWNAACNRYEAVLNFAKENGLKVRKGMKLNTIKAKIAEAGLTFA